MACLKPTDSNKRKTNTFHAVSLVVKPLCTKKRTGRFDIFESLVRALQENRQKLRDGDILVVSTKFLSNAQGRILRVRNIRTSGRGYDLSKKFQIGPKLAEVILRESDDILGGIAGFVMTSADNIMAPNAGIDRSNAGKGALVLYPADPYVSAEQLRRKIFLRFQVHAGVILADSRLMPLRVGTSALAVACAGMEPVLDMRARKDLDGNPLKVTFQAVADNIATIANHAMGEGSESRPFAIVRDSGVRLTGRQITAAEMAVPPEQCVYVRSLRQDRTR